MKPEPFPLLVGKFRVGLHRSLVVQVLVAAFVLLSARPVASAEAGSESPKGSQSFFQGDEPGKQVPINLQSGSIQKALPFDVHFFMTGSVEDGAIVMEGRSVGLKTARTCQDVMAEIAEDCSDLPAARKAGFDVVDCNTPQKASLTRQSSSAEGTGAPPPGVTSFEIFVPALQPNRYYCFEINWLSEIKDPKQIERFQTAVRSAVFNVLNREEWVTIDQTTGFARGFDREAVLRELRHQLIAGATASLEKGQVLGAEPGTFFHADTPLTEIERAVGEDLARISDRQVGRLSAWAVLRDEAREAADALAALASSPHWKIAAGALLDNASQPRVEVVFQNRRAALGLIGLGSEATVRLSEGRSKPREEVWDAGDINLAPVKKLLTDLQFLADDLRKSENLRKEVGLDETGLAARISAACGSTIPATETLCRTVPTPMAFSQELLDRANAAIAAFDESQQRAADQLTEILAERSAFLERLADSVRALLIQTVGLRASTIAEYETRATWYLGADLGTALAMDLEEVFTYVGANIYFRPVNKKAPLRWADFRNEGQRWTEFRKRFSVTLGMPQDDIDADNIEPLIQGKPALVGAGLRLSDSLRFNVGALVFKEKNPNPLLDEDRLVWSPLVGLSIDWNVAGSLKGMFENIFPGTKE